MQAHEWMRFLESVDRLAIGETALSSDHLASRLELAILASCSARPQRLAQRQVGPGTSAEIQLVDHVNTHPRISRRFPLS